MRQMADLIGAKRAAPAGGVAPAKHPGLEKGAIDDQLPAALEQVEQGNLAPGPVEFVGLLHWYPGHPSPLGGQGITGARECLLLQKQPLPRFLPVLLRHHRRRFDRDLPFQVLRVSLVACWHVISPLFSVAGRCTSPELLPWIRLPRRPVFVALQSSAGMISNCFYLGDGRGVLISTR